MLPELIYLIFQEFTEIFIFYFNRLKKVQKKMLICKSNGKELNLRPD
jgi:hypothetical protein